MKKDFLHLYIITCLLLISPSYAQSQARGLLKHLDTDYIAQDKVMKKQQEVLIAEILKLKAELKNSKLKDAEAKSIDFSLKEKKLLTDLTFERKRVSNLEKENDLTKAKYEALKKALTSIKEKNSKLEIGPINESDELKESLEIEKTKSSQLISKLKVVLKRVNSLELDYKKKVELYEDKISKKQDTYQDLVIEKDLVNKKLESSSDKIVLLEKKYEALKKALEDTSNQAKDYSEKNEALNSNLASLESEVTSSKKEINELESVASELSRLKIEHSSTTSGMSECLENSETLNKEILSLKELEKEYISLKNESMLKNTETKFLSKKDSNIKKTDSGESQRYLETKEAFEKAQKDLQGYTRTEDTSVRSGVETSSQERVLTVTGSKVNLRNGPGLKHSPMMQISKGAKLTIEAREGEWYRVYSPTGSRAYVHQDVVEVGSRSRAKNPSKDSEKLVAFGSVRVAGRSEQAKRPQRRAKQVNAIQEKSFDTADLAMQKLRAAMGAK